MNSSSPIRVHFINTITIIRKEDEPKEEEIVEPNHDIIVQIEEKVGEELSRSETVIGEGESRDIKQDNLDTRDESVYESLIEKMSSCSLSFDFRIEKGDPSTLKIPCMIGRKFIANAYIDLDSPMNVMPLACYNAIKKWGYKFRGHNFIRIWKDMHVFVGNMSHIIDFTILENIEANIDHSLSQVVFGRPFVEITKLISDREQGLITFTDGIKEVTFKTPYKDSKMDNLTSEGHDLSSRVILSEDDYKRGCERASNLEIGFYMDVNKLDPSYKEETDRIDLDGSFEVGRSRRGEESDEGGVT
ncbi:hypothetical protein Tco_0827610 [Tanacetum coccineum]